MSQLTLRQRALRLTVHASSTSSSNVARLTYRCQWPKANLHHSIAEGKWSSVPMTTVPTGGGRWKEVVIPLDGTGSVVFAANDGGASWDNNDSKNYKIDGPGRYSLRYGDLKDVTKPAFLVVSDLDGTLIGNDQALEEFQGFWESQALQRGCKLVYSSGRHLGSFQLLKDRLGDRLPFPDMYIGAVGTKIFQFDTELGELVEDVKWSQALDTEWDLELVERAAADVIQKAGGDSCHLRPAEELNEHKITLGIKTEKIDMAIDHMEQVLSKQGVKAKLIYSGTGDWRYLDIVANGAGKLESLEYVRLKLGFTHENTIACGDSGNDLLMLSGKSKAIVVGNAQKELLAWLEKELATQTKGPNGLGRVYHAKNHEAAGVMEGLERFGWK